MDFKGWLLTEGDDAVLQGFLTWIGQQMLSGIQPGQGEVVVRFPRNYSQYFASSRSQAPQPQQTTPMALAAHYRPLGLILGESLADEDPHGKGGLAYRATAHMLPKWNNQQVLDFKVGLRDNIVRIGKELGLLFEIEIFQYLVKKKKLRPGGENEFTTYSAEDSQTSKSNILATIAKSVGPSLTKQFVQFVQAHAWTVAEQIFQRTVQILNKCRVDYVEFVGGDGSDFQGRGDPADLRLGCSSAKKGRASIGYSTKFTSESKVHVTSQRAESLYGLMSGPNPEEFSAKLDSVLINFKKAKEYLLRVFGELAEQYEGDPAAFTKFLEGLLTGGKDTFPAARLYIRGTGGGNWSQAMQRDFITSDNQRGKLQPRPGASVTVNPTNTYIKIIYKVPGGTPYGTFVVLEPYLTMPKADDVQDDDDWDMDRPAPKAVAKINVKMNNLATDKFN